MIRFFYFRIIDRNFENSPTEIVVVFDTSDLLKMNPDEPVTGNGSRDRRSYPVRDAHAFFCLFYFRHEEKLVSTRRGGAIRFASSRCARSRSNGLIRFTRKDRKLVQRTMSIGGNLAWDIFRASSYCCSSVTRLFWLKNKDARPPDSRYHNGPEARFQLESTSINISLGDFLRLLFGLISFFFQFFFISLLAFHLYFCRSWYPCDV